MCQVEKAGDQPGVQLAALLDEREVRLPSASRGSLPS
jgi:hypothetical protein